jgi:hypothetical protein
MDLNKSPMGNLGVSKSKLILAAPNSPAELGSVLCSPWGRGKRRTDDVKINWGLVLNLNA